MALTVDEFLELIGQFGPFQIRVLIFFSFIFFPATYQTLIMYFLAMDIPWRCTDSLNNTNPACINSSTVYMVGKKGYDLRCSLKDSEWEYDPYAYDGPRLTIVNEVGCLPEATF